jgi:hypothetical protein
MAVRNSQSISSSRSQLADSGSSRRAAQSRLRHMLLEQLEQRQLLAVGPQLIGIQPNSSDLLSSGDVRTQAPNELVFRFDDSQVIDAATLRGIRITSAGKDGSFGTSTAQSDFGSNGGANIQLSAVVPGQTWTVQVTHASLAASAPPTIAVTGSSIAITLNTNPSGRTTANALVSAINSSVALTGKLTAQLNGGLGTAPLGIAAANSYAPIAVNQSHDRILTPGAVLVGQSPNENEVTFRFAETLKDDNYRIEIFGFDDPSSGVVGLRNTLPTGTGDLFVPSVAGTRKDTVDFRLDLGPQVIAVVPQPVVRVGTGLQQQRDTVVVYFDTDKLLVENNSAGQPTARSVENPAFYQLIFTSDTVRNTDDTTFLPTSVKYNAATNTATLKFSGDLNELMPSSVGPATYRLRIGTRETTPTAPTRSEGTANVITDLNTDGAVKLRLTSRAVGESAGGTQVIFLNTRSGTPAVSVAGNVVTVDMGRDSLTAAELLTLLRGSTAASNLFSASLEPGSVASTVVGNTNLAFSPLTLVGLGSSFDTASNLGVIGSATQTTTSLVLSSAIDPQTFALDLPGASDDPAHRQLAQNLLGGFEDHVNPAFGADATDGITTIYYNFQAVYGQSNSGIALGNSIGSVEKARAREVLSLWSKYIGVQFVETSDLGLTIAAGPVSGIATPLGTTLINEGQFSVAIDPTFQNPLIVLSATNNWGTEYGASYTRTMAAAVGIALGLEHAGDLPETTLLRLDPTFLAGSGPLVDVNDIQLTASDEKYEPIVPGNQDILHASYLYRPDGTDIDLYRFEVDFGAGDRVGILTAETYAQRLGNSSPLDTELMLFRQQQASATTTMGATVPLSLRFEAVRSGAQGNQLQIFFTQTERGNASKPTILTYPNAISIDLNSTTGSESTVQDIIDAIKNSPAASSLVRVSLVTGAASTKVGDNLLSQNPVTLVGGGMQLVSQNDDYFSRDSLLTQSLGSGVYYLGVSASGNDNYNASIDGTGFGGQSQGNYDLRLTFRAAVDASQTIQDAIGSAPGDVAVGFDGDSDGVPGGSYDFWFQTRPLQRTLTFNAGASSALEGRTITVTGASGASQVFEFSSDTSIAAGRVRIAYTNGSTAGDLANALANAITSRGSLGVGAIANGVSLKLSGERSIAIDPLVKLIDVAGKTIFVDKSAGPNADGSLAKPFNNISGSGVPNAFSSTFPGDIVRIVGNGGVDNNLATEADNFAYEIGNGLLAGSVLSDGVSMDIPKGVTTMIDAGAVFKLRGARIGVGSSNLSIDRSGGALQVLGAPVLLDASGNAQRKTSGAVAEGLVYFTSWLDESIGFDAYTPTTTPTSGNWGGISFRHDVDSSAGRQDLENEGIFLQYINHADIRYGGGTVVLESISQTVYPIQMIDVRPTITDNRISRSSSAAMSAAPNSFEETNFNEPRFQQNGAFTSDYDRVGPEIRRNTLLGNSLNALFVSVGSGGLSVAGRFDDVDIVHVLTDNLIVNGTAGGALIDGTAPPVALLSLGPNVGGTLLPGVYNYKVTYVDRNGYESAPSDASAGINLTAGQTAISVAGLPSASGDFVERKLYRSQAGGAGPYRLVAKLDRTTSTFLDIGQVAGGTLARDRADVSAVTTTALTTGTLAIGTYSYRVVMVDAGGREGLASSPTAARDLTAAGSIQLTNLPLTLAGYTSRRIYRSSGDGTSPYVLVGELSDAGSSAVRTFTDVGSTLGRTLAAEALGVTRPRLNASLVIDPGAIIKLEASRIEAMFGANIIAEGTDGKPVVFTSKLDDTVGAGGTFDTNNNGTATGPSPRDWGGIYVGPTSSLSVDYARFAYGGGVTKLDSTFRAFNTIEVHQADARIAHTLFENNADGFGGQGPGTRLGRLSNEPSTIFVRGAQPTILGNVFRGNTGSAITIDANSMTDDLNSDPGRQTGAADRNSNYLANRGPLIRENRFVNNGLNGLKIRGDTLTTASVWDDTDIVHVVYNEIFTGNVQHEGGLRLQSASNESLVVKFDGYGSDFNRNIGAGLTANGQLTSATDRVGGTLHVLGQPGFPVILTSLFDDTVGAGLQPDGTPQTDTNNDGIGSIPQAADWRGLLLDQYSNDRNVGIVLETENFTAAAPGPNGDVNTAQVLGGLASSPDTGNEQNRLGFVVEGVLSQSEDIDVYSFAGTAGAEVWFDIDQTRNNLDLVLELLDANGQLLARSDNSTAEAVDPSLIFVSPLIAASSVNPLVTGITAARLTSSGAVKEAGTTNPLDPGLRVRLPGAPGNPSTFFVRVRSASTNANATNAGLTSGSYQLQVRLREEQEWAGSSINYADIRYAMNGVHLRGLPGESPLIGEAAEDESVRNGQIYANNGVATGGGVTTSGFGGGFFGFANVDKQVGNRPQYVGNLLASAKGAISVAGNINSNSDVDFYMLEISQNDIVGSMNGGNASVVFDMDYADGLNRPDTSLNIFREVNSPLFGTQYQLVYSSDSSNIADDQGRPLTITDVQDLSRGSMGTKDPYIGPVALPEGNYLVGISSAAYQPRTRLINPATSAPIPSIRRIVDDNFLAGVTGATPPVVTNFLPRQNVGPTGELVSKTFDLGAYSAADLPNIYLDYTRPGVEDMELFVRDASGAEFAIASSSDARLAQIVRGSGSLKLSLGGIQARPVAGGQVITKSFAGENGLTLIVRSTNPAASIDKIIIGFGERGESVGVAQEPILLANGTIFAPSGDPAPPFAPGSLVSTRQFSLVTYSQFPDGPQIAFDYEVFDGQLDVWIVDDATGQQRWLGTTVDDANRPQNVTLLQTGSPESEVLDISFFAGRSQLRIEFRGRNDDPSRTSIRNVVVQLADGSRVGSGEYNSTYVGVPVPSTTVTTGNYQLEIRLGEQFFQSQAFGSPIYTKSFDTNDRLAEQISLIAPAGNLLTSGDKFSISDGGRSIVFEFTTTGAVGLGNVPVRFQVSDPAYVVARAIRDAINSSGVQAQFQGSVRAASSNGEQTGTTGKDTKINLHGTAYFKSILAANPAGAVQLVVYDGKSDSNARRQQGEIIIQNSYIRQPRDYGVWSEPAARLADPRDTLDSFTRSQMQEIPKLVGTQAVRNLSTLNNGVQGGMLPGLVVQNNVLEEGGLGGVKVQGETPIWMISPRFIPYFEPGDDPAGFLWDGNPLVNTAGGDPPISHFGSYIDDQDTLVIDADRTRVRLEFDDLAGGGTGNPVAGSGQVEGNGVAQDSSMAWYRDTGGSFYQRLTCTNCTAFATTAFETMHAMRDSILSSMLVSNGTTQQVNVTIAASLLGPDPDAPAQSSFGYPLYFNRPAVYIEGATTLQWQDGPNGYGNPFDIRQLDLGETPQPQALIINNTIIGTDGRASFNGESGLNESNDTIADAVQTWQGTAHNPLSFSDIGIIGDGGQVVAGGLVTTTPTAGGGGAGGGGAIPNGAAFSQSQLLVAFNKGVTPAQQDSLLASHNLAVVKRYDFIDAMLVRKTTEGKSIPQLVNDLSALPQIRYAEPNYIKQVDRTSNDPRFSEQWGYNNTGQTGGTPDADIDLTEAWDTFTGSSTTVIAILDTGVDYNHPDLRANMWINPGEIAGDGIDNDGNGYIDDIYGIDPGAGDSNPMDEDGHGTHVAGTTSAVGNNGIGVTGVNWNAKIMALKGADASGGLPNSATIEAMNYMVMMKTQYGVNIVVSNHSYGGGGASQAERDAIAASTGAGIVFVAAAGNSGTDNDVNADYPSGYDLPGIISVAATDHNDLLAGFSQFGLTTVDVGAPGVAILSTTLGGGYGLLQGTSMASPHVAGVVGLLAGAVPGASVAALKSAILLGADPIASLNGKTVSGARLNAAKSLVVMQAGLSGPLSSTDVDIYQFKLGIGERAIVDIDSSSSGLDSVLQIFDSNGVAQTFVNANGVSQVISDNDAAPGEVVGLDPYADFTALKPGVYYAAISSKGNSTFDPLSLANRQPGTTTGAYRISISARHLQDFVITAQDASAYAAGDTFTIYGVPDVDSSGSGRTFEFVIGQGGPTNPNNIPINIDPGWRFPDVARAIAKAINEGGTGRGPAITNAQSLPNGIFGTASPLPPVFATALGGISAVIDAPFNTLQGDKETIIQQLSAVDELGTNKLSQREIEQQIFGPIYQVNQGLELFPRRNDGFTHTVTTTLGGIGTFTNISSLSHLGIGHDRLSTQPISYTSRGDGTSEKFIKISNAAWINGNGTIIVDPDQVANNNLDQLLPETGVLASRGASPTVLNNVFFNVQTPVINEESRRNLNTSIAAPYGSPNPNVVTKPGQVVLGGSVYQYYETAASNVRFNTGIEASPTNIPNTALDQNVDVANGVRLFVNAQAGEYLPAAGSPIIDTAINKLDGRASLAAIASALGLPQPDVLAPAYDLVGQLRADDPSVSPPGGIGQNIFKDRGALERADFIGPAAILLDPIDNDALGIDGDSSDSVVQLNSGVYPQFRIQLADGNEPSNPLLGIGVDDNTVVNSVISGKRLSGAAVVVFENGRVLREGIDYSFAYNATRDEIILTPLAGVWKNGKVYEISINNQDRFVISAPSGDQVADGDQFTITDENGGVVHYEFDSGYRLQVPQGLTLQVPLAGGAFGGIVDGDRFSVTIGSTTTTFEFDRNNNVLAGNRAIPFQLGASQQEILDAVIAAIGAANLSGITPAQLTSSQIFIGAEAGVQLNTSFSTLTQPNGTLALRIPDAGPRGGVLDGHTFTLNDGRQTLTFEYDTNGTVGSGHVAIDFSTAISAADIAQQTRTAIAGSGLNFKPTVVAGTLVHLGMSPSGSASIDNSKLTVVGVSRTLADGEKFTITGNGKTVTFELTRDATVASGNVAIPVAASDTQSAIADRIVAAIAAADLGLSPQAVGPGNIAIGGSSDTSIDASAAPGLTLFGKPGVQSKTRLQVFGPLILQLPAINTLTDNSTVSLQGNGKTVVFEFDGNGSGASAVGNVVVPFTALSSQDAVGDALAAAISGAGLNIAATNLGSGKISLGQINSNQVLVGSSGLTVVPSVVSDGETFTISNGLQSVTFEFNNVDLNNGFNPSNTQIQFSNTTSPATLITSMKAAIEAAGLGLTTNVLTDATLELNDTPRFAIDVSGAPTLVQTGVPGGANPVWFIQDPSFTGADLKRAIIAAINASPNTNLVASDRGDNSLFVSGATVISPEIDSYFLRGVADLAGNLLKPNQINNETKFTILMPGVTLDFGDAPDPLGNISGRYPTLKANDGARHVVGSVALLGSGISADVDGQPKPAADGDTFDDGVVFGSILATPGLFNRNVQTPVTVTLSTPGFVDGWIDFNADGDWDDPGEQILSSTPFTTGNLTQTFMVTIPATAPNLAVNTQTFARFRSSSVGGLVPTGLAADGEVEDYAVTLVPGSPPTAVDDTYVFNEDPLLAFTTTDPTGTATPGFTIDDGVAANDTDPDGGTLNVTLVTGPSFARPGSFQLNSNGTFTYRPLENFNGQDTFVYRVNDGVLGSNNFGTVTLTVREVNDPPIAGPDTLTLREGETLTIDQATLLANDVPGPANESAQTLNITSVSPVSFRGGSVTLVGGQITYVPPENYSGSDSFTYVVTDNGTTAGVASPLSATGTVTLQISDRNNPPITVGKSLTAIEDTSATMTAAQLLAGDTPGPADESSQTLTVIGVTAASTKGGTVTFAAGVATYTPAADFEGVDTFFYQVQDNGTSGGVADPQTSTGTVTVTVAGVPDAPRVAGALGTVTMAEDDAAKQIDLSTVFFDPDVGDTLSYSLPGGGNSNPSLVTATISAGRLVLSLQPNQNGTATVVVQATDSTNRTVLDTLTLTVTAVNDPPVIVAGLPDVTVLEDATIAPIELTPTYFFDPDVATNGDVLTFEVVGNTNPLLVTPTISGNQLQLTLSPNRSGFSDIRISAKDSSGQTVIDQFRLTVTDVNDVPVTQPDTYRVKQGQTLVTTDPLGNDTNPDNNGVLANDHDPEGSALTAILVAPPSNASQFSLNANGTFSYQHDFSKGKTTDSFSYQASDGSGLSVVTTVTIVIDNPPPPSHQNPDNFLDVNADGFISPIDALLIINVLNSRSGSGTIISTANLPAPPPYLDTDGNNIITANDVLQVINYLNAHSGGHGEGEGESAVPAAIVSTSAQTAFPSQLVMSASQPASLSLVPTREPVRDLEPTPLQATPLTPSASVFAQVGDSQANDLSSGVDMSWLARRDTDEDPNQLIDLALASLLTDFSVRDDLK